MLSGTAAATHSTEPEEKFAHSEGYTTVKFSYDGTFFMTGGNDSLIRAFKSNKSERDQEAQTFEYHSDGVLCLDTAKNRILVSGGEDSTTYAFNLATTTTTNHGAAAGNSIGGDNSDSNSNISTIATLTPKGTLFRSTLSICDVSASPNGMQVAIASHEDTISIVSLIDIGMVMLKLPGDSKNNKPQGDGGHKSPINSVHFSSDSRYLASSSCDGTIKIWDMQMDSPCCVKTFEKLAPACQVGDEFQQFKIRWSPDGSVLAVPGRAHDIHLIKRGSWTISDSTSDSGGSLRDGGHSGTVTHLAWSPTGRYLSSVSSGDSGNRVIIWEYSKRSVLVDRQHSSQLCQVEWHPHSNTIAFSDAMGSVSVWDDVIPKGHLPPHVAAPVKYGSKAKSEDTKSSLVKNASGKSKSSNAADDLFNDEAVDDANSGRDTRDSEDTRMAIGDNDDVESQGEDVESLNNFVVDDDGEGAAYIEPIPQWTPPTHVKVKPFQPGATPLVHGRQYLALNLIGSVVTIRQENASHNIVEVDFYDKSAHRDTHFRDTDSFCMASLSNQGCLFASKPSSKTSKESSDDAKPSLLSYRAFSSWSTVSNWVVGLPFSEEIECIALSSRGAAAVTSLGYLRLFTIGGVQLHIESLPNRVLTCTAYDNLLFIILESTGSLAHQAMETKEREYEYILMSIDGSEKYSQGVCVVSKESTITWAHFTEEGHPVVCDSAGIVRVLHRRSPRMTSKQAGQIINSHDINGENNFNCSASWIPIIDIRELARSRAKNESLWPVAITGTQLMTILCKDGTKYPTYPKPILAEFSLQIPLLRLKSQVGKLEEHVLRSRILYEQLVFESERTGKEYQGGINVFGSDSSTIGSSTGSIDKDQLEQDKSVLRLIQLACKDDKMQRAMDLVHLLYNPNSISAAIKIAMFNKQSTLAERLVQYQELVYQRNQELYGNDEDADVMDGDEDNDGFGSNLDPKRKRTRL
ncbi:DNA polymerase alpha accessory factor Mcl1 [Mycoemilia scoparia]|uniref:DNA polymerase alpha accessory factor Mcl1 n=1 Tax=Mycoemilia scoparia TaxID=417184 RepID=A0A9W7ZW21_9FUNG|nr:DNA polymerase alpha accessory factor Mcl1 [Mycoemilia scoparia]